MSDKTETILDFDFGFTAMTEDELTVVQDSRSATDTASATAQSEAEKAQLLYNAITPLLNNLKANPEKDYIYWPDRYAKLDAFADKLQQILTGE